MYILIFLLTLWLLPAPAQATPLDFEVGGTPLDQLNHVTQNYGGVDWSGMWSLLDSSIYQSGWHSTLSFPSGDQVAFNGGGLPMLVDTVGADTMTVAGAWFAPWTTMDQFDDESAHTVTMEGYVHDVSIGSVTMNLDPGTYRYLATNFGPVDYVRIRAEDAMTTRHWFLMDNIDITVTPGTASVPEPSTWLLLALGLVVLGWKYSRLVRQM